MHIGEMIDLDEFKDSLFKIKTALQEEMSESKEYPEEAEEILGAISRLEKDLDNKKSLQLLSDFFLVYSMFYGDDDEDEDYEDDEDDEDEDEYLDEEEER